MLRTAPTLLWLSSLLPVAGLAAQDWPNWRGPNHDGTTAADGLPASVEPGRAAWTVALPGPAASTPIVVGDRVFLTSTDTERERLVAMCVSLRTGEVAWKKDVGSGYKPQGAGTQIAVGPRSNYASPSPTSDGEVVVWFFGNGDLVGTDLEGAELWRHNIQDAFGDFAFQWTFSASPTLWDGKVYLPVLQRDTDVRKVSRSGRRGRGRGRRQGGGGGSGGSGLEAEPNQSFVLCLDAKSGEQLWRHVRPAPARVESLEAYTTMIPHVREDGTRELLLAGGDIITGHEAATGKEIWRWGTWNEGHRVPHWRLVPSPVVSGDVVLVCAPKREPVYAVRLGGEGDLGEKGLVWKSGGRPNPVSSDVPTPAAADGFFYVLSDVRKAISKVKAADGEVVWTTELQTDHLLRASPTLADGRLWFLSHGAELFVVDAASGEVLSRTALEDGEQDLVRSSVVVAHGRILARTNDTLFCFGGKQAANEAGNGGGESRGGN